MTLLFELDREAKREHPLRVKSIIIWCGLALTGLFILLSFLSKHFSPAIKLEEKPVLALVVIMVISGAVYIFTVVRAINSINARTMLAFVLLIGVFMRLAMFSSIPMLEDDYNRYLWDGAVTANGINPYRYSPEEVVQEKDIPLTLKALADESGEIIHRINHPQIRSIYPPVTQALFALSYIIKPWSLTPWRATAYAVDAGIYRLEPHAVAGDIALIRHRHTRSDFVFLKTHGASAHLLDYLLVESPFRERNIQFGAPRRTSVSVRSWSRNSCNKRQVFTFDTYPCGWCWREALAGITGASHPSPYY